MTNPACLVPEVGADVCALLLRLSCVWPGGLLWSLGRLEEVGSSRPQGTSAQVPVETWVPAEAVEQPRFHCNRLEVWGPPEPFVATGRAKA